MDIGKINQKYGIIVMMINNENPKCMNRLARLVDCTYSHAVKLIGEMEEEKVLTAKKIGRNRVCLLTTKGLKLQELFREIEAL